ncbi:ATPase WRNIP1-like [Mercenaria mercenaria]|uniref:ATPase WRNIP1-like n=1 Tax=Mercenaria mercenaria TaxID=6596 RepID=UPI00234E44D0|nr:ATPase WRNIP1-like [Mercenaria mercenaria]
MMHRLILRERRISGSDMEDQNVACPVCNKKFSSSFITEHVNRCLNNDIDGCSKGDTDPSRKKRKLHSPNSGWGFLMSNDKSDKSCLSKRQKLSPRTEMQEKEGTVITIDEADDSDIKFKVSEIVGKIGKTSVTESEKVASNPKCAAGNSNQTGPVMDNVGNKGTSVDMSIPLAEQMRPACFENYIGQDQALGKDKMLRSLLQGDNTPSMILWGPPGCGKTTLAKIVAKRCKGRSRFVQLSATSSGVSDVKEVIKNARNDYKMFKKRTILFLDEIHRFNKLQQDSLLPNVEDGTITLIGATTENPSFQVNTALISRCRVVVLDKLDNEAIMTILMRAVEKLQLRVVETDDECNGESSDRGVSIEKKALQYLSAICDGDARAALNGLQMTVQSQLLKSDQSESVLQPNTSERKSGENGYRRTCVKISVEDVKEGLQRSHIAYDKTGEEHYNIISALHKSMRGSDDSAALYWLARMMEGGEEILYIARRLIEFASEDVGLADPQALMLAVSTYQACHFIGRPECEKPLAECVIYLSRAPKSIEAYNAYSKAKACVQNHQGPLPGVPLHLRNAPTKLMKNIGYGKGYKYNPAHKGPVEQEYFPECLAGTNFFK